LSVLHGSVLSKQQNGEVENQCTSHKIVNQCKFDEILTKTNLLYCLRHCVLGFE